MAKEFFKNLPDTSTPLTATRFNGLLDGGESQGNLVVESISSKNMFGNYTIINGWIYGTGMRVNETNGNRMAFVKCEPNTTYTISRSVLTGTFRVGDYTSIPIMTSSNVDYTLPKAIIEDNSATSITYTTSSTAQYLIVHYGAIEDTNLNESLVTIQVEKGSTATTYTSYNAYGSSNLKDEDVIVGSIRTKNMFDSSTFIQGDITNAFPTIRISSRQILWLEPGTYTFSTNQSSSYQFAILVQNAGIPPLSTQPTLIYNRTWADPNNDTFTLQTGGWITIYLRKSDNTAFSTSDISNLLNFNYQLEKGSAITTYSPYQNLDGKDTIILTSGTLGNYFSTVDSNFVVKSGNIVQIQFRALVNTNIPNNIDFYTSPYGPKIGSNNELLIGIGGHYDYNDGIKWGYVGNAGNFRCSGIAAGKWIHISTTFITED